MTTYSKKLQDPRWQKKRLLVFERDNFKCTLCGDDKTTLNVHHEKYFKQPWDAELDDLKTLCFTCHSIVELCKDENQSVIHIEKYIKHTGDKVCNAFVFDGIHYHVKIYIIDLENYPIIQLTIIDSTVYRFNSILKSL